MFDNLDDAGLLSALDTERKRFTQADDVKMAQMVEELIRRGVYPKETIEGNRNSVMTMVEGWGAYWYLWKGSNLNCPHCKADLRDLKCGPPFMRVIGISCRGVDRVTTWRCPDCNQEWPRT